MAVSPPPFLPPGEVADLTNCDREPIHLSGAIQPHGLLLVVDEARGVVRRASANAAAVLGHDGSVLGQSLDDLVGADVAARIRHHADHGEAREPLRMPVGAVPYDVLTHRTEAGLTVELEFVPEGTAPLSPSRIGASIRRLQGARGLAALCTRVAEEVRHLTGFDRVKVYRFDDSWNGKVVAEARAAHMASYLDLHFPAFDIPRQARHLYRLNPTRLIADVAYTPVPIEADEAGAAPLDLTHSALRSVSPLHLTYLQNMGVEASMSISILDGDALWGLVACHHATPLHVPADVRQSCELLSQVLSIQLPIHADAEDADYDAQLHDVQAQLVGMMGQTRNFTEGLTRFEPNLLDLVHATGAAVVFGGTVTPAGVTPPEAAIRALVGWLDAQHEALFEDDVYATHALSEAYPPAEAFRAEASGLMAVPLARRGAYLLWFREEVLQTVSWAGDPIKGEQDALGRLQPRASFAAWQQQVRGTSAPWQKAGSDVARALRTAIVDTVLRYADDLATLNSDLQRSNEELDSFAYIASHDLKEPLRGIHHYAHFLIEDYADKLDEDGRSKLHTLQRLSQRMDTLLTALLHYARLGRQELDLAPVSLDAVVEEVLDVLAPRLEETRGRVTVDGSLPTLLADPVQITEVFTNLVSNALKYAGDAPPDVRIAEAPFDADAVPERLRAALHTRQARPDLSAPRLLTVRDTGIGIAEQHLEAIFKPFRRLHAPGQHGGGSGAGLAIVERIVQRHGGLVWATSEPGAGTTFHVLL